jgi:hypothetical protein
MKLLEKRKSKEMVSRNGNEKFSIKLIIYQIHIFTQISQNKAQFITRISIHRQKFNEMYIFIFLLNLSTFKVSFQG